MLDKEVMVHLPMESRSGNRLGPGGITRDMRGDALAAVLAGDIAAVPNAAGVSNHMGSLITPQRAVMGRVMDALSRHRGLYFVDSHTVADSVALAVAREHGIPAMKRDVFLDHDRAPGAIRGQFRRLIRLGLDRGRAIGIGHPYRETIEVLDEVLRNLDQQAVRVIRVSTLLSPDPDPDPDRGSRPAAPSETALGAQSANFGEDLEVEFRANVGAGLGQ